MKKICLSFVLTVIFAFSVSAQTNYKLNDDIGVIENDKISSGVTKTKTENIKTTGQTSETDISKEKTPGVGDIVNLSSLPVLLIKKSTLGSFSTGNPQIDGYIEEFSALYSIDPLLIYAQMFQESSFKGKAVSPKGASGYMQLMPDTARRFGVKNIYNPKQNIQAGIKYMRWLLDKFNGDISLALAGYNAGEGSVIKYGNKIPPYRETQTYVAKILNHYEQISNQNQTPADATNNKINETVSNLLGK